MATALTGINDHDLFPPELRDAPYLPQYTVGEYLQECRERYPALYKCLNPAHLSENEWRRFLALLDGTSGHFEAEAAGGRGDAYRREQNRQPLIRARGIRKLFQLVRPPDGVFPGCEIVLDVLGGNGTLSRAMHRLQSRETLPLIVTSDVSPAMIADALAQHLPAIREPAQMLLLADSTVDGVIFAYGTHHIPPDDRVGAFKEAYRVLRPGGRIVVQDFEENSPTARWYSELLDRYTMTGHKCRHFSREDLGDLVAQAGFHSSEIIDVYDPFVVTGARPEEAQQLLIEHVCTLFDLKKLFVPAEGSDSTEWKRVRDTLRPYGTFQLHQMPAGVGAVSELTVRKYGSGYVAEFPRVALVAVATKPGKTARRQPWVDQTGRERIEDDKER